MNSIENILSSESDFVEVLEKCKGLDYYIGTEKTNKKQKNIIIKKINLLIKEIKGGNHKLLARSECKSNIKKKLGFDEHYSNLLFSIGDKAKNYYKDEIRPYTESPVSDINDYSKEVINWIFDECEKSGMLTTIFRMNQIKKIS